MGSLFDTFITFRLLFVTLMVTLAIGLWSSALARRAGLLDVPGTAPHKQHKSAVPVAGGITLFVAILLVCISEGIASQPEIRAILIGSAIAFGFGLLDDVKNLSPIAKFVGQFLAGGVLIFMGVQVRLFTQDWLNIILTLFWLVGVTNAYNFVDSMDGLAAGLAGLAAAFFMLVTIGSNQQELSILSIILLGACLGAFYYNNAPARFFLGDSGSQLLGFLLASLAIAYNPVGFSRLASWYVPILLAGVPIFDTSLVVYSRLLRGKPVYMGACDHTFHRLIAHGMSANRAVLTMHTAALLLGCLAFIVLPLQPLLANAVFAAVLLFGASAILLLDHDWPPQRP